MGRRPQPAGLCRQVFPLALTVAIEFIVFAWLPLAFCAALLLTLLFRPSATLLLVAAVTALLLLFAGLFLLVRHVSLPSFHVPVGGGGKEIAIWERRFLRMRQSECCTRQTAANWIF
jgi:hypothetical protein